jgi:toxin ParE1/3/4
VILQPAAERDLIEHFSYIARNSDEPMARRFLTAAYATFDQLAQMPRMGSSRRFRNPRFSNVRMWRVEGFEKHLIFYRPLDDGIRVLRLLYGSRDIERLFRS